MQRTHVAPTPVFARYNFDTSPPTVEESESSYTATWVRDSYVAESAFVAFSDVYEYALGPKVCSAGWYNPTNGNLRYVNTLFNYVPHYRRSYTLNTILEAVPGDQSTQYKVLADIDSNLAFPPAVISAAFEWFGQVIDDDDFEPEFNAETGFYEYIFVPSQHMPAAKLAAFDGDLAAAIEDVPNTNAAVSVHSHDSVQKAITSFAEAATQ